MEITCEKLEDVLRDIEKLKKAKKLLDAVRSDLILFDNSISDNLRYKIQDFYRYYDSE